MTEVCNPVLETDTIKYSVQPGLGFLADKYYRETGSCHTGIDLNDVRGGDSDLGNRVRAVAKGVVVAAGKYKGWGGIVVIHHPDLGVWTQYAHLNGISVKVGDSVLMGDRIGVIGKGALNQYWAHLHFEVRKQALNPYAWPSNAIPDRAECEAFIRERYLDPELWLQEQGALRTLEEVMNARNPRAAPPAVKVEDIPATPAGTRIFVNTGRGQWQEVTGKKFVIDDARQVVINAKDPGKIQIRYLDTEENKMEGIVIPGLPAEYGHIVTIVIGYLAALLVGPLTAIAKKMGRTEGPTTVMVSFVLSLVVGIGYAVFTSLGGGAFSIAQAVTVAVIAFIKANGDYQSRVNANTKANKQAPPAVIVDPVVATPAGYVPPAGPAYQGPGEVVDFIGPSQKTHPNPTLRIED